MKFTRQPQISDSLILNLLLAFSGGFQDAYTYVARDHVFANAQTGNIVLMSAGLMKRNLPLTLKYAVPVFAFALGVFVAEMIHLHFKFAKKIHWRQAIVLMEIASLFIVGFIPPHLNFAANALVSFSCALQIQSFKKVSGNVYASTMCIGNLRSATESLANFICKRDKNCATKFLYYICVIGVFAFGAGIGVLLSEFFFLRAIWGSCIILALCYFLMQTETSKT